MFCQSGTIFNETDPSLVTFQWSRGTGSTPTFGTGPDTDQNVGSATGYYLYINVASAVSFNFSCSLQKFKHLKFKLITIVSEYLNIMLSII